MKITAPALLLLTLTAGCSAAPADEETGATEDGLTTSYGQLFETLSDADYERWRAVKAGLVKGFDNKCGDTICSGDYSNLTTVNLTCSSTKSAQKMKDCLWVLGGNIDFVDGKTGKLTSDVKTFVCHVPVAATAKTFLAALEAGGDHVLDTPLPGTGKSFYDALTTCFEGVVGPLPPSATQTFYAELDEHLNEIGQLADQWEGTRITMNKQFDDVCGDTFCEGDYSDIVGLRLACSVNKNSKRVSRCGWSFSGAAVSVDAKGKLTADTFAKRCDVAIGATESDLVNALSNADPLNTKLPNSTKSLYDGLVDCLP